MAADRVQSDGDPPSQDLSAAPIRWWWMAAGIAIVLACQAPVSGFFVAENASLVASGTPDSLFLVDFVFLAGQGLMFLAFGLPGFISVRRGHRGIGLGLLIGWGASVISLCLGAAVLFVVAS
jgi:hypothetical protein